MEDDGRSADGQMTVEVTRESASALDEYARIPISFEVRRVLDVARDAVGGFVLSERAVDAPYVKDYDAVGDGGPLQWPAHFDLGNWAFFAARVDGRRVGGAAVVFDSPEITMLEGRADLAVLWDLRVAPEARGRGIGAALFRAAGAWAAANGCRQMKIETQNVNVPACRFYARQGCMLGAANRFAYPGLPNEVQLLWYRDLVPRAQPG